MEINKEVFFEALINGDRFDRTRAGGQVDTENLFKLQPVELKEMGRVIAKKLSDQGAEFLEELFNETPSSEQGDLSRQLEVIKSVLAYKQAKAAEASERKDLKALEQKLLGLQAEQEEEQLKALSPAEIKAQLEAVRQKLKG